MTPNVRIVSLFAPFKGPQIKAVRRSQESAARYVAELQEKMNLPGEWREVGFLDLPYIAGWQHPRGHHITISIHSDDCWIAYVDLMTVYGLKDHTGTLMKVVRDEEGTVTGFARCGLHDAPTLYLAEWKAQDELKPFVEDVKNIGVVELGLATREK